MKGKYFSLLRRSTAAKTLLDAIKSFSDENLYNSRIVRERELTGYRVLTGILDRFGELLELPHSAAIELLVHGKTSLDGRWVLAPTLSSFLPKKHLKAYCHAVGQITNSAMSMSQKEVLEWMARAHLLTDFVSGMTDDFAIVTFKGLYSGGTSGP